MRRGRGLYLAARAHLEQADAVLAGAGEDVLELRGMIRYVAFMLDQRASSALPDEETVVAFPLSRQGHHRLEYYASDNRRCVPFRRATPSGAVPVDASGEHPGSV